MRHAFCVLCVLALALLFSLGVPGFTAAQGNTILPPLRLITAARFEHLATEDGRPIAVTQGYKESRERFYLTAKNLETGDTTEVVLYDGQAWTRLNDEREWRPAPGVAAVRTIVPTADTLLLYDGTLSALGAATIGGATTEHYQIWGDGDSVDPTQPGFVKVDFYVGVENRYLYQFVIERTVPRLDGNGLRRIIVTVRFFDHDDPELKVTPPHLLQGYTVM